MRKFKDVLRRKVLSFKSISDKGLSPVLCGDNVTLRAPMLDDYAEWREVRQRNKNFLTPYEPEWPEDCLTLDFFRRRLIRQDKDRAQGCGAYFLIYHHETQKIIGGFNLNNIQMGAARHASLGYWLDEKYQGQGLMSETLVLIVQYSFNVLKLKRLNAACLIDNQRSVKMLLRAGFEEEGLAKKYFQINGTWQDHKLFGLCATD